MERRAGCVRCVFDQRDPAARRELDDLVHAARVAAVVHDEDCACLLADRSLDVSRVRGEILRPDDVAEDGRCTGVCNRVRRRDEVERRHDDLVAGAAADGEQRKMDGRRPVRDCERVLRAGQRRELALELGHPRSHAPPAGPHDFGDRLLDRVVDAQVGKRHEPAHARRGRVTRSCPRSRSCARQSGHRPP